MTDIPEVHYFGGVRPGDPLIGRTGGFVRELILAGAPVRFYDPVSGRGPAPDWAAVPGRPVQVTRTGVITLSRILKPGAGPWLRHGLALWLGHGLIPRPTGRRRVALVSHPAWPVRALRGLFDRVAVDVLDDAAAYSTEPRVVARIRRLEIEGWRAADVVTAVSPTLCDEVRRDGGCPEPVLVPNGWAPEAFSASTPTVGPFSWQGRHGPVAGFVGALYHWFHWPLLVGAAERCPDVRFVLIGPHDTARGTPPHLPSNVECHDAIPPDMVPAAISTFDVCLVPFRDGAEATAADPLKVYEYLAAGRAVVSTLPLEDERQTVVRVERGPAGFATAILEAAAASRDEAASAQRREAVRLSTWRHRVERWLSAVMGNRPRA